MKNLNLILILLLLTTSCSEIKTNEPNEVYKYWAGSNPPKELQIEKGKYWQSAHWTREYIMYLKLNTSEKWWNEFSTQNQLEVDTTDWIKPSDSPNWFKPSKNSIKYKIEGNFDQGSRYFRDKSTGESYLYEIQL